MQPPQTKMSRSALVILNQVNLIIVLVHAQDVPLTSLWKGGCLSLISSKHEPSCVHQIGNHTDKEIRGQESNPHPQRAILGMDSVADGKSEPASHPEEGVEGKYTQLSVVQVSGEHKAGHQEHQQLLHSVYCSSAI